MHHLSELAATRAARAEQTIARKVGRYEQALLVMLGNRPHEKHDTPITDQEHLTAAQFAGACEAYERSLRGATPRPEPPAPAPRATRRVSNGRRRKKPRAKTAKEPAAT